MTYARNIPVVESNPTHAISFTSSFFQEEILKNSLMLQILIFLANNTLVTIVYL